MAACAQVWIRYKRSQMEDQKQRSSRAPIRMAELLAMPAPTALPSRSSSAWWAVPGPLQPRMHQAWQCYKPSYDALTATNRLAARNSSSSLSSSSQA
jgi:hypothetical protein